MRTPTHTQRERVEYTVHYYAVQAKWMHNTQDYTTDSQALDLNI